MADMAEHAMTGQGSSLVRRAAQMGAQRQPPGPPSPPPQDSQGSQGESK